MKLLMETRVEDIIRDEDLLPKYRDAGVIHLYLGAEGSTDEMLASLNKGTDVDMNKRALDLAREHDIMTEASFMIGGPEETWESIERTIDVAIQPQPGHRGLPRAHARCRSRPSTRSSRTASASPTTPSTTWPHPSSNRTR